MAHIPTLINTALIYIRKSADSYVTVVACPTPLVKVSGNSIALYERNSGVLINAQLKQEAWLVIVARSAICERGATDVRLCSSLAL